MRKVFTKILPCGILPALSQHISRACGLGIFENQYCLRCLRQHVPEQMLDLDGFEVLSRILPMFTGQTFFQTLSTRMVESMLLGMVHDLIMRYACIRIRLWK